MARTFTKNVSNFAKVATNTISPLLVGARQSSFFAWVKANSLDASNGNNTIINVWLGSSSNNAIYVTVDSEAGTGVQLTVRIRGSSADAQLLAASKSGFTTGRWYSVGFIANYAAGNVSVYLNGKLENVVAGTLTSPYASSAPISNSFDAIGMATNSSGPQSAAVQWDGQIEQPTLWRCNIGSAGMLRLHEGERPSTVYPQQIIWWPDCNSADAAGTIRDYSHYAKNLTVTGTVNKLTGHQGAHQVKRNTPKRSRFWTLTSETFTSTGTWLCPPDVTAVVVEAWGGGAGGGGLCNSGCSFNGAGGGGGGAYAKKRIAVTPGTTYTVTVGAGGSGGTPAAAASSAKNGVNGGDSWFSTSGTVLAKGGIGGIGSNDATNAGGAGGASGSCIGDTVFSGGTGGNGPSGVFGSGGGGSSAGTAAAGNPGTVGPAGAGGTAPSGGGNGGLGGGNSAIPAVPGADGSAPGGGGGGKANGGIHDSGYNGAAGQLKITYPHFQQNVSKTVSDSAAFSDGATRTTIFNRSIADSFSCGDSAPETESYLRTATTSVTFSHSAVSAVPHIYDSIAFAHSATYTVSWRAIVEESIILTDEADQATGSIFNLIVTDRITFLDRANRIFSISVSDSIELTDIAGRIYSIAVTDSCAFTHDGGRGPDVELMDVMKFLDQATETRIVRPIDNDVVAFIDHVTWSLVHHEFLVDSIRFADSTLVNTGINPCDVYPTALGASSSFVLSYPVVSPSTTLTLRVPRFGNVRSYTASTKIKRTTEGFLRVTRGPNWPKIETFRLEFYPLTQAQRDSFIDFNILTAGSNIKIVDQDNVAWQGIITDPVVNTQQAGPGCQYRLQFTFRGTKL